MGLERWKMVKTFDTDCAKIGVLICYDVEFPELSRIMADQGMQILFVPFLTTRRTAIPESAFVLRHVPLRMNASLQ